MKHGDLNARKTILHPVKQVGARGVQRDRKTKIKAQYKSQITKSRKVGRFETDPGK